MQHFCTTLNSNFSALEGITLGHVCDVMLHWEVVTCAYMLCGSVIVCGVMLHWEVVTCAYMLCGSVTQPDTSSHIIHTSFLYSFVFHSPEIFVMVLFKSRFFIFADSQLPTSAGSVKELDVLTQC